MRFVQQQRCHDCHDFWFLSGNASSRLIYFRCFIFGSHCSMLQCSTNLYSQYTLSLMFVPSNTVSSSSKTLETHKAIFCSSWYKVVSLSVASYFTPVSPHFPTVSKIIQVIRLPSLISCL